MLTVVMIQGWVNVGCMDCSFLAAHISDIHTSEDTFFHSYPIHNAFYWSYQRSSVWRKPSMVETRYSHFYVTYDGINGVTLNAVASLTRITNHNLDIRCFKKGNEAPIFPSQVNPCSNDSKLC